MKNQKECEKIVEVLSKEKEVLAIFNNGSSVVGMDDWGSDLDFVAVMKKDSDEEKLRNVLRKNFVVLKNEEHKDVDVEEQWDVFGKRADVTFISKKKIDERIGNFYKRVDLYLELQNFVKHKIIDSVAIYDPDNLLKKWKKEAEKDPKRFMKRVFSSQIKAAKEELFYWKNHKFRNEFQFGFEQWHLIKAIFQALYAKNNEMFMLPYKRVHKDLKKLKPNIEKEMYELISRKNDEKMIEKKIKIVEKILRKLK